MIMKIRMCNRLPIILKILPIRFKKAKDIYMRIFHLLVFINQYKTILVTQNQMNVQKDHQLFVMCLRRTNNLLLNVVLQKQQ